MDSSDAVAQVGHSLFEPIDRAVRLHGTAEAVVDGDTRLSYADLWDWAQRLASGARARGVETGDRVAVLSVNSAAFLAAYFAVPVAGMVFVPLNHRLQEPELVDQVMDCAPTLILTDASHHDIALRLAVACRGSVATFDSLLDASPHQLDGGLVRRRGSDLAAIFYTGGTSGRAKGVMLTHENLAVNALHMITGLRYETRDVYLHCAPMFHLGDGMSLYPMTWVGGRHVVIPRFDPEAVVEAITSERVTCVFLVPTMLTLLIEHLAVRSEAPDLSSLRLVVHGGAPISGSLLGRALDTLGCSFTQSYGMTEAGPILSFLPEEEQRLGSETLRSAGQPVVGADVRVLRPDGSECAPGEVGEIVARGPNIAIGYWNQPDVTRERFRGGWYWSGDLARRDEEGYLYIVGRVGDVIISGGENVYAAEVEAALDSHPDVVEAAVFAVPSERWGESVHAAVALRSGVGAGEALLDAHCRALIAGYKIPRSYEFHDSLPRTGPGKIDKRSLRAPYWRGVGREVS
jgi:long-chain acyl-CoA synthetase